MPRAERASIPAEYGIRKSRKFVDWSHVEERLTRDRVYWLATIGENGAPHVRPVDGLYLDGAIYVGGSPKTRWARNVRRRSQVTVHLDGTDDLVIVEGEAEVLPDVSRELAERLAAASNAKFPEYAMTADNYGEGVTRIRPRKVIAWTDFASDPTRFTFDNGSDVLIGRDR